MVSKSLYIEGKENNLLPTGDGSLNVSNPHNNPTKSNSDIHLVELRKLVYTHDPVNGISEKQYNLQEEYDSLPSSYGISNNGTSNSSTSQNKLDQYQLELRKQGNVYNQHGIASGDSVEKETRKLYHHHGNVSQGNIDRTFTLKWEVNLKENNENTVIKRDKNMQNTIEEDNLTLNSSTTSHHLARTTPPLETLSPDMASYKKILFYTSFFSEPWDTMLHNKTDLQNCPVSTCAFVQHFNPEEADALVFHFADFSLDSLPAKRRPEQLYIWFNKEPPEWEELDGLYELRHKFKIIDKLLQPWEEKKYGRPGFFNWTMTYHRASDVMIPYGTLWPLTGE